MLVLSMYLELWMCFLGEGSVFVSVCLRASPSACFAEERFLGAGSDLQLAYISDEFHCRMKEVQAGSSLSFSSFRSCILASDAPSTFSSLGVIIQSDLRAAFRGTEESQHREKVILGVKLKNE